jgi:hypothetical protein
MAKHLPWRRPRDDDQESRLPQAAELRFVSALRVSDDRPKLSPPGSRPNAPMGTLFAVDGRCGKGA